MIQELLKQNKQKGLGLVEVLIASSIVLAVVLAGVNLITFSISNSRGTTQSIQAAYLLDEGVEAVKFLRDQSFTGNIASMSPSSQYGISFNGTSWATSTTRTLYSGIFDRYISVSPVYRDSNSEISTTGTLDPATRFVTVSVSWNPGNGTTTKSISTYITNLFNN